MPESKSRALLVSFSGIDGAGKSTQIDLLHQALDAGGVRVARLAFWNHGAALPGIREFASHSLFKGDRGIGTPERPVRRKDKNIQAWPLTIARLFLYLLDAIHLKLLKPRTRYEGKNVEVVIFDRYLYDELANLPLENRFVQAYARWLMGWMDRPDVAYLLAADVTSARERKPEYEVDFLRRNQQSYLLLSSLADEMQVIPPAPVADVQAQIARTLMRTLPSFESLRPIQHTEP